MNPTGSEKLYPTPPRRAHALETNALSLTPDCVDEEMQCTSLSVTAAIRNTLLGSTTRFIHDRVREHLNNEISSVKNISIPARTKTIKALMSRLL